MSKKTVDAPPGELLAQCLTRRLSDTTGIVIGFEEACDAIEHIRELVTRDPSVLKFLTSERRDT